MAASNSKGKKAADPRGDRSSKGNDSGLFVNEEEAMSVNDDSEDDGEEEEYVVEAIEGHDYDAKTRQLFFRIRWLGWPRDEDKTWEPEDNLENAHDILIKYYADHGGRENLIPGSSAKKRKRPSSPKASPARQAPPQKQTRGSARGSTSSREPTPKAKGGSRQQRKSQPVSESEDDEDEADDQDMDAGARDLDDFEPPTGSWEDAITSIDTVEKVYDPYSKRDVLAAYVTWKTGHQRRHPTSELRQMCPQLLISFYESHVTLAPPEYDNA